MHTRKCMATTWNHTEPFSWVKFCFCLRKYQYEWNGNNEINRMIFVCLCLHMVGWMSWIVLWHIQICRVQLYMRWIQFQNFKGSSVRHKVPAFVCFPFHCIARGRVIFLLIWLLWVLHRTLNMIIIFLFFLHFVISYLKDFRRHWKTLRIFNLTKNDSMQWFSLKFTNLCHQLTHYPQHSQHKRCMQNKKRKNVTKASKHILCIQYSPTICLLEASALTEIIIQKKWNRLSFIVIWLKI